LNVRESIIQKEDFMDKNKEYAQRLKEMEGYERKIIAFKLTDETPQDADPYGDDFSFYCAIVAEIWEEDRKPFYVTNKNIMCGGAVHSGLVSRHLSKEEFDMGLSQMLGKGKAYETRKVVRRTNQQSLHFFKRHKYQVVGALEDIADPDVVMVVADAHRIMRLCKVYTWKTGELTHGLAGAAWCSNSFPLVYRTKTMTYNMGDPPSRRLMNLAPGEMYCFIHYDLLPMIVDNFKNISSGEVV
jgi:uncharacterized protein (DUF169 family)